MPYDVIGISVLWLFLFGYLIIASIDFGAGFFNAYSLFTNKYHMISHIVHRYLSPVWEVTNVFLVFFFVGIVGFFPQTAYYYGTVMLVPVSISLLLLAIRGAYYAFTTYGKLKKNIWTYIYGVTGLFIPASLTIAFTVSEGGFIDETRNGVSLRYWELFTSPLTWSIVLLSLTSVLYISAVFLTWYAVKAKDYQAASLLRKYALTWALPTIITASGIIVELRGHNPTHFNQMLHLWWLFALSVLFFCITVYLLWRKKHEGVAVVFLITQFFVAFFAYGLSHYPYLLYPYVTLQDSLTSHGMAVALIVAFIAGVCLLLPSLYLLFRLFLFDKDYVEGKRSKKKGAY
ncbi:cytochrome d ubiquinol oxidase subunit II [Gracilibacillus halophilus YIM-C55.5]|uniref:Cytochrome d ubiquinol oxidase subunit II n=1 Tax=Gracilibacillus halophilus YIM-C55.5 TaxID=1308866 RepID=N4WRE1_9BACI|nr:cytochrome d ubiquinol oxidase subunit II [Gracilibacillus halophilus]ENH95781.1 cytochrome d ubiquinol oxidase subunit II [Gracilibacillus halophilus YIM-C55.5]